MSNYNKAYIFDGDSGRLAIHECNVPGKFIVELQKNSGIGVKIYLDADQAKSIAAILSDRNCTDHINIVEEQGCE
jgi:hypothetical protein